VTENSDRCHRAIASWDGVVQATTTGQFSEQQFGFEIQCPSLIVVPPVCGKLSMALRKGNESSDETIYVLH
jgi:hypothetical protein